MKNLFYFIFILIAFTTKAQVLSYDFYSFKVNNMFNVNPAYTGKDEGLNIVLSAQTQNKGVNYANKNYMFGMHSRISKKQALGTRIISDTRGAFQILKADLSYAYIAKINDDMKFTLGLSAGLLKNSLLINRIDNYQMLDQSDPTLTKSYYNTNQFAAGAGFLYNYKGLDLSFSMPHIITTNEPFNSYINAAAFYTIKANDEFKIIPWLCYQRIPVTKDVTSFFVKGMYKDMIWIQGGYQTNKTFCAMFGVNIENLSIGYGYKSSNSQFKTVTTGFHEITFGYKITEVPDILKRLILPKM
ncbi:MAG: PorP/SprF family type IX secretion system membrane protein [Bacteroidota bacterium]